MTNGDLQHHIQCRTGDVARYVLLPGNPRRAETIAQHFDVAKEIARNREYVTYTGTTGGVEITVTSTGIGGPSVAIAVEELVRVGADTLIRVGTGGAMQKKIMPGELVVGTGAIRDEGTSRAYMPIEFPAVGDHTVTTALAEAAADADGPWHMGIIHSKDSFFGQKEPERMPVADQLQSRWKAWVQGGALFSEMESATLFVLASLLGVRAGSICVVGANDYHKVNLQEGKEREAAIGKVITASLGAVQRLATSEN